MDVVIVESPAKAKTINKYLGPGYRGSGLLRARARSPRQGRLGAPGRRFLHGLGGRSEVEQAALRHRLGREARRARDPRHRPGSRGRGDILARAAGPARQERAARQAGRPRRVQRRHPPSGAGGDEEPARDRRAAGRCIPRAPRTRLSRGLHALTSVVAKASGRALGRPRAVGGAAARLRPRGGDRAIQAAGILVGHRASPHAQERSLHGAAGRARREEAGSAGDRRRGRARTRPSTVSRIRPSPSRRWNRSRSAAIRRPPSSPQRCSRKPSENSASMPATRCASLSASTRVSISAATPSD